MTKEQKGSAARSRAARAASATSTAVGEGSTETTQRVALPIRLPPDVHRHLQLLGVHERKKLQALLMEGIARVFMDRGDTAAVDACRRAGVKI